MDVPPSLKPLSRCGTISQAPAAPLSIFVKKAFTRKKDKTSLSAMKRVIGASHRWCAKVFLMFSVLAVYHNVSKYEKNIKKHTLYFPS